MSIGETISAAREAQGMTQSDLAGKVFVTRQAVSRWETGATTPGVDMCKLLAAALDPRPRGGADPRRHGSHDLSHAGPDRRSPGGRRCLRMGV